MSFRHDITNTANVGLHLVTQNYIRTNKTLPVRSRSAPAFPGHSTIGRVQWFLTTWLERARVLNSDAERVNANVATLIPKGDPFRGGWDAWFQSWKMFYERYVGPNASKLGQADVSLNYEEFDADLNRRQAQFDSFLLEYNAKRDRAGNPLPRINPLPPEHGGDGGSAVPWWFWVGAGTVLTLTGYLIYRKIQEGRAKAAYVKKEAPGLLEHFLPGYGQKAYGYSQAGRDEVGPAPGNGPSQARDPGNGPSQARDPALPNSNDPPPRMTLAYYAKAPDPADVTPTRGSDMRRGGYEGYPNYIARDHLDDSGDYPHD